LTSKNTGILLEGQGTEGIAPFLSFALREARIEDLEDILEIYNLAVMSSTASFDTEEQSLESRREWFQEHDPTHPILVAVDSRKVAAYCSLSRYSKKNGYAKTVEMSVYVRKEFRRRGMATALMKEAITRARKLGYHAIISVISSNNFGSLELHRKMGFEYRGELREVGFKFETWQSVSIFELILI
jgi:L-amino acid N-acyltransferase YncA